MVFCCENFTEIKKILNGCQKIIKLMIKKVQCTAVGVIHTNISVILQFSTSFDLQ